MATSQPVKGVVRQVRPLISLDKNECRKRVIGLYKAWYRQLPAMIVWFHLPYTTTEARIKLKNEFMKHKDLQDIRTIDMLVIKGQLQLKETVKRHKQESHVLYMTRASYLPRPTNFLAKFLSGND